MFDTFSTVTPDLQLHQLLQVTELRIPHTQNCLWKERVHWGRLTEQESGAKGRSGALKSNSTDVATHNPATTQLIVTQKFYVLYNGFTL